MRIDIIAQYFPPEMGGEAINIGTGKEIKISDLAEWINEITGNDSGIIYNERRNWDKKARLLSSIEKAQKILGYKPGMDFKEGLKQVYAWFKDNQTKIEASYK
ncbi:MAG: hypothetical protein ACOWW1_00765 [archaeon]